MLDTHSLVAPLPNDRLLLLKRHQLIHLVLLISLDLNMVLALSTLQLAVHVERLSVVALQS